MTTAARSWIVSGHEVREVPAHQAGALLGEPLDSVIALTIMGGTLVAPMLAIQHGFHVSWGTAALLGLPIGVMLLPLGFVLAMIATNAPGP